MKKFLFFIGIFNILVLIPLNTKANQKEFSDSEIDFLVTPIITPVLKVQPKKSPPPPGLNFGIPSGFGASSGSASLGISYSAPTETGLFTLYEGSEKKGDGSMSIGVGLGNPKDSIGTEFSVAIISMTCQEGESCFGADGTVGIKFHKLFSDKQAFALGFSNLVKWGEADDTDTLYAVTTRNFTFNEKGTKSYPASWSLGFGNGTHRSQGSIDADENNVPNIFGGAGIQLMPRLSFATSWNGSALGAGFGVSPFDFPLTLTLGVNDITDKDSRKYSISTGYSISF